MPLKLGTVAPVGFEEFPIGDWLAQLRRLGCEVVQAYRNAAANVTAGQMKDYIAAGGMPCDSLHAIFGEEYDPSAPDEQARLQAVDTYRREGELALELGGPIVVVHCSTIRRDGVSPEELDRRVKQLEKSISELGAFGRDNGLEYLFENLPGYHPLGSDMAGLATIMRRTSAENTSICLDTGHAHMTGGAATAVLQARDLIRYVHFSDNFGERDEHLMPGEGSLDLPALADALAEVRFDGTIMLEVFYDLERMKKLADGELPQQLASFMSRLARSRP
jgi:sugar phosphate isomerase/epimerase